MQVQQPVHAYSGPTTSTAHSRNSKYGAYVRRGPVLLQWGLLSETTSSDQLRAPDSPQIKHYESITRRALNHALPDSSPRSTVRALSATCQRFLAELLTQPFPTKL